MKLPRRQFMRNAAAAAAAFTILPRHVLGTPAQDRAQRSREHRRASAWAAWAARTCRRSSGQNIVAMCDVDWSYVDARFADIPKQIENAQQARAGGHRRRRSGSARCSRSKDWQELQPKLPKAKRYTDYREMLEKQKNIDAVVIATPDHTHALIALAAMDLGQTRVRAEAARLVGGGMPPARASAPPRPNCRRRWAIRATRPTMRGW